MYIIFDYRYQSQSDLLNLTIFDQESILKQIENNYNNEERENNLLSSIDINDMSFIIEDSILLNNTYTVDNFPEIENSIEGKLLINNFKFINNILFKYHVYVIKTLFI